MRFLLYDRIDRLEKGLHIQGVKTFSQSEECLRGHFDRTAVVPGVLWIEAMAQLLGWLIVFSHDFACAAIMSLIQGVRVPALQRPGFAAEIHGRILSTSGSDSLGMAWAEVRGEEVARLERIIYTHIRGVDPQMTAERFNYVGGGFGRSRARWEVKP